MCLPAPILNYLSQSGASDPTKHLSGKRAEGVVRQRSADLFAGLSEAPDDRFLAEQLLEAFEGLGDKIVLETGGEQISASWLFAHNPVLRPETEASTHHVKK